MRHSFSESDVGPGLSPGFRPAAGLPAGVSRRRPTGDPAQFKSHLSWTTPSGSSAAPLETLVQGDAPIRRVARSPKNAPDRRISIGFTMVRGPQAHRDSAEAPAPQELCGIGRFRPAHSPALQLCYFSKYRGERLAELLRCADFE